MGGSEQRESRDSRLGDPERGRTLAPSASGKVLSPGPTARPDVKQMLALQITAGNAALARAVARRRNLQRMPAAFATTPAVSLKAGMEFNLNSGWGLLGYGSWDAILAAIRAYANLPDDAYETRKAALAGMPALIASWEADHEVRTATTLDADEKAKVAALGALRTLIGAEHRELAALGAGVDEKGQAMQAFRFKGDYMLEQVLQGRVTLVRGDHGLYVTKVQQALADTSHLASDKVTGTFEEDTATAVKAFQKEQGLPERGYVGRATMVKLATIFEHHGAEKALAQAPAIGEKGGPGEFAWGSAPAELTAGARSLGADDEKAAQEAVKTSQVAGPGGVLPTFVSNLSGKGTYEARLKALVLSLAEAEYNSMAKGKAAKRSPSDLLDWDHIKRVAARSKQATDAVFGKFAVGPPLQPGAGIHDAWDKKVNSLKTAPQLDDAANWRVEKLLTGNSTVAALDRQHGAIQNRDPEKAIVEKVKAEIVAAKRAELVETHKAWPAFASGGEVNIQRFKAATSAGNRDVMWHLFQTVVHEYLHTLEHSRYKAYRSKLGQQAGAFTLREGVVEYFTHTVLESVTYDDALRLVVEGEFHDASIEHRIHKYQGYGERVNAEKMAGVVGARNVMAAFFLGDIEKIGGEP